MSEYEIIKTQSRIPGLQVALTHKAPTSATKDYAVLCLHGASFPSMLSFAFRMNGYSWMDNLAENGYDVYALDFLGYGNADRYPGMDKNSPAGTPAGRAMDVYLDVDYAVECIRQRTGKEKVYIIAHSWGGSVAALYATKFPDKVAKLILFAAVTQRDDTTTAENIEEVYDEMTPEQRVEAMQSLTPTDQPCQLEPEILRGWGNAWLRSDPLAVRKNSYVVRFPKGYAADLEDMTHGRPYYHPVDILVPVLVVRGEWDSYPDNADAERFFRELENAPSKKYVVIEKGTHVLHLEKKPLPVVRRNAPVFESRASAGRGNKTPNCGDI